MGLSPITTATIQSAILGATSNIVAQAITAYRGDKPFIVDWVPVFQFFLFTIVSTPPNFMWQDSLETAYPATTSVPSSEAISSASRSNEKELDREAREGKLVEAKLNVPNTIIKFILDQSIGAAVNTLLFSLFTHSIQQAMSHRTTGPDESAAFLVSGWGSSDGPLDYSQVNWRLVLEEAKSEFYPIMKAGWALWPWVSLFNFVVVKSVEVRSLVGALAGMVWGVYMSLISTR
ncbi:PXMP2/4 family protein 3 [Cytospora mali]|uniref:PXMP2/4 family protein 3 n=1 Tax=Cytospora mali TaxID=578113 RepID=A0A194VDR6_CYTMA|nr:PXMP2/4 family protein 3 [Valsa mali var. pyri (nom. inval.)]